MLIISGASAQEKVQKFTNPEKLPASVNTDAEEVYPLLSPSKDQLYFVRTYRTEEAGHKKGQQDIFVSRFENNAWQEGSDDLPTLNNKANNAAVGISKDGQNLYLLGQYLNGGRSAKGVSLATKDGEKWDKPSAIVMPAINFKGDLYGFFVTPDERVAIVSANLEGGTGKEDLYVAKRDEEGKWVALQSLGSNINTNKAEFSPFVTEDGKYLYFSSYGHDAMGESDIFVSERLDDSWTNWSVPVNLGEPINSKGFDAYLIQTGKNEVYFSSNRGNNTDIYKSTFTWEAVKKPEPVVEIKEDPIEKDIKKLKAQYNNLDLIYFPTNKADVKAEDAIVLDAVISILEKYENLKVSLTGHTDNVGSESSNERLSERRVKAAKKYLVKKGVSEERISTGAYGETKPRASNDTEEGRAQNRRVEISIEKIL